MSCHCDWFSNIVHVPTNVILRFCVDLMTDECDSAIKE